MGRSSRVKASAPNPDQLGRSCWTHTLCCQSRIGWLGVTELRSPAKLNPLNAMPPRPAAFRLRFKSPRCATAGGEANQPEPMMAKGKMGLANAEINWGDRLFPPVPDPDPDPNP